MSDLSRVEQLLRNALGEDIYNITPQSRVEELLAQLNELIEGISASVDPEVLTPIVTAWLDDHPEATTTVEDGSLTEAKFTDALKLKTLKDYVTPQMFGAVGDGVTDDTTAFVNMLASENKKIVIPSGEYKITSKLLIPDGVSMIGCGDSTILKRYATESDQLDFLLVGGEIDLGNFNFEILSENSNVFQGSFIKINEESLLNYNRAEVRTTIHDISALCRSNIGTNNDVSAIEFSLQNTFGNDRTGFCDVSITNYNVRCASGIIIEYYCKVYTTNSSYWITGITFDGGFINNCKWGFFPMQTDDNLFDDSTFSGNFTAICKSVQMQAQNGTKGFVFLPYNKSVKMRLIGCIPWDFTSKNTYPYYFDYRRVTKKQNASNDYMNTDGYLNYTNYVGVQTDNTLVPIKAYNLSLLLNYIGENNGQLNSIVASGTKLYYVPHAAKAVKLYSITLTSGRRTIVFRYLSAYDGHLWATVSVNWVVGNIPTITIDGQTSSVKFGYKITQSNNTYTLEIYAVRSNSGNLTYLCFESLPFSNSQLGYDNSGQGSSYIATINMDMYPSDEVYLTTIPNDISLLENTNITPLFINGTDENGNSKLYKLIVENGVLSISTTKYWYG